MDINKKKEILELRKLYLTQFEKLETKVLLIWSAIILLPLFVLWTQKRFDGLTLLIIALFTCILDLAIELWRKRNYNNLIKEINIGKIGEIQ